MEKKYESYLCIVEGFSACALILLGILIFPLAVFPTIIGIIIGIDCIKRIVLLFIKKRDRK